MDNEYKRHDIPMFIDVTKLVTIHYFEFDKDFKYDGERHDFWELVYADKGDINITADTTDMVLRQGEIYFHKPNEFHKISANGVTAPKVFIISFICDSDAMSFFEGRKTRISSSDKRYISSMISEANRCYDLPFNDPDLRELKPALNPPVGGEQMIKTYLEQMLILLIRSDPNSVSKHRQHSFTSTENRIVPEVIRMLEQNIYGRITVEEICAKMQFSKTYISRIFAETTGYSIGRYYATLKIEEAKQLIREGTYNFAQISDLLKFTDPQYFSRVFKRITRMTPTKYSHSVYKYK